MSKVKLMVEVDEDYYEAVKESVDVFKNESFYPFVLIANGTVITDDCISREALKNYARKVMYEQNATNFSLLKMFDEIIDNASASEAFTLEDMQNNFDLGAMSENGKHDRPKGEWKTVEGYDGDEYYECSNCGEPWELIAGTPKENNMNFCPNCGADMRGAE